MHDEAQLERLHREHAGAVRAFVRRRIGDDDADDVVAEVFVVAWRRLDAVPAAPRTWLVTWDGLSHAEAAEVLGVRVATLTMRLHRARSRLERAIEADTALPPAPATSALTQPSSYGA